MGKSSNITKTLLSLFYLVVFADIVLVNKVYTTLSLLLFFVTLFITAKLTHSRVKRIYEKLILLSLALVPVGILFGAKDIAEKLSIWAYMLLIIFFIETMKNENET